MMLHDTALHWRQELPSASGSGPSRKRAAEESVPAGSEAAKRARRLLGRSLLGTLQRFRAEDEQFQASDAASRRQELQRKAEEKSAAETERLRKAAAEERLAKR